MDCIIIIAHHKNDVSRMKVHRKKNQKVIRFIFLMLLSIFAKDTLTTRNKNDSISPGYRTRFTNNGENILGYYIPISYKQVNPYSAKVYK